MRDRNAQLPRRGELRRRRRNRHPHTDVHRNDVHRRRRVSGADRFGHGEGLRGTHLRPISSEGSTGVEVIWDGTVQGTAPTANKEISGNLSIYKVGSWELPSTDMLAPVGSLVYAGNEATKLALTSGTLSATAGYGTIDAKFINGGDTLHLQGTWFCAA